MRRSPEAATSELRAAWEDFERSMAEARDCLDVPDRMPAPASDRLLAEGYRYLMGYMHAAIERAFRRAAPRHDVRDGLVPSRAA